MFKRKIEIEIQHGELKDFVILHQLINEKETGIIMIDFFVKYIDDNLYGTKLNIDAFVHNKNLIINCVEMNKDTITFDNKTEVWVKGIAVEDYSCSVIKLESPFNTKNLYRIIMVPLEKYVKNDFQEIEFIEKYLKMT
jgi:hypothetical protein